MRAVQRIGVVEVADPLATDHGFRELPDRLPRFHRIIHANTDHDRDREGDHATDPIVSEIAANPQLRRLPAKLLIDVLDILRNVMEVDVQFSRQRVEREERPVRFRPVACIERKPGLVDDHHHLRIGGPAGNALVESVRITLEKHETTRIELETVTRERFRELVRIDFDVGVRPTARRDVLVHPVHLKVRFAATEGPRGDFNGAVHATVGMNDLMTRIATQANRSAR